MLRRLSFANFKSWAKADLEFGRITGLFGTNSSGKTALIQFLLLLKQTKDTTDRAISLELNGPYVGLGAYRELIHRHAENKTLSWSLQFELDKELSLVDPSGKRTATIARSSDLQIDSAVSPRGEEAVSTRLTYRVGDVAFSLSRKGEGERFSLKATGSDFQFERTRGRPWELPRPVKSYAFPDQARTYFQNASFLSDIEAAYEEQIDHIYYPIFTI